MALQNNNEIEKAVEMNFFILQSLILIALAYLVGAILGCWLRKMFAQSASILHAGRDGLATAGAAAGAAVSAAGAVAATRLAGREGEASIKISRPDIREVAREEIRVETRPEIHHEVQAREIVVEPARERETITYVEPEPTIVAEPVVVAAPVVREEVSYRVEEVAAERVAEPIIDDLTRIKGVGLPIALELKRIGVTRFEQVARWTDRDVADVSSKLGFSGRIERENWMAQANILASGDELEFTTHQLRGTERSGRSSQRTVRESQTRSERTIRTPRPERSEQVRSLKGERSFTLSSHTDTDDLKLIAGIGVNTERLLREIGVDHFAEIAAWSVDDVVAVARRLELEDRIDTENWIDQARKLVMLNS